jgi:hypothetical protein
MYLQKNITLNEAIAVKTSVNIALGNIKRQIKQKS